MRLRVLVLALLAPLATAVLVTGALAGDGDGKRKMHRTNSQTLGAHGHIRSDNPHQEKSDHNSPANTDHPALTLDDLTAPKLRAVAFDRKQEKHMLEPPDEDDDDGKKEGPEPPDAIRNEALRIMRDLINLGNRTKTASIPKEPL